MTLDRVLSSVFIVPVHVVASFAAAIVVIIIGFILHFLSHFFFFCRSSENDIIFSDFDCQCEVVINLLFLYALRSIFMQVTELSLADSIAYLASAKSAKEMFSVAQMATFASMTSKSATRSS